MGTEHSRHGALTTTAAARASRAAGTEHSPSRTRPNPDPRQLRPTFVAARRGTPPPARERARSARTRPPPSSTGRPRSGPSRARPPSRYPCPPARPPRPGVSPSPRRAYPGARREQQHRGQAEQQAAERLHGCHGGRSLRAALPAGRGVSGAPRAAGRSRPLRAADVSPGRSRPRTGGAGGYAGVVRLPLCRRGRSAALSVRGERRLSPVSLPHGSLKADRVRLSAQLRL